MERHSMQARERPLRVLLIGPLPPPVGGTTILFQRLVQGMRAADGIEAFAVNTSRGCVRRTLWSYLLAGLRALLGLAHLACRVDVVTFHASVFGAFAFSPVVHFISGLYKKPWVLRKFGGVFDSYYGKLPRWAQAVVRHTALAADLCLFETQQNARFFGTKCRHETAWYPNNRPLPATSEKAEGRGSCRRFVFCGQVMPTKGVGEIIAAAAQLEPPVNVDIYGPCRDGISPRTFEGARNVRYCGVLESGDVLPTLDSADAMLLPTYHRGEGYPGAILDAYAAGIPVIATRWRDLPEIVDETSGILVEPRNVDQVLGAMQRLVSDDELYRKLCTGATEKGRLFDSETWTKGFVDHCRRLAGRA
jgi:glycosyltransferase involved in cell wall biosynthesis